MIQKNTELIFCFSFSTDLDLLETNKNNYGKICMSNNTIKSFKNAELMNEQQ
jgi:hypothetical protein